MSFFHRYLPMLLWIVVFALFAAQAFGQPSRIDSLKQRVDAAQKQHNDTATVLALNDLAYSFWSGNSALGIEYAERAVRLADSVGFLYGKALALCTFGWCLYNQSQYVPAMEAYLKGQAIAESLGEKAMLGRILEFKGILYRYLYKYPERALQEHLQALDLMQNSRDSTFLVELWEDVAIDYTMLKNPAKGIEYFTKTLPYLTRIADTVNLVVVYSYLGECHFLQGDYQQALATHEYVLAMAEKGGFNRSIGFNKARLARLYNVFGKPNEAIPLALAALVAAKRAHSEGPMFDAYRALAESYRKVGAFENVAHYQDLLMALEDSAFQDRIRNSTLVQQVDFNVHKKEAQIQLLQKDGERRMIIGIALAVLSVMLVVIVILLYRNARREHIANTEIQRQLEIQTEQAREIEVANTELQETNLALDATLHDLQETQSQLVESERMNAAGMLTAGVMHEINNPNAAVVAAVHDVKLTVQHLKDFFFSLLDESSKTSKKAKQFAELSDDAQHTLEVAASGAQRVQQIVANLQHFTKHQRAGQYESSLAKELASTIEIFRYQFKHVMVDCAVDEGASITGNFGELNQVFLNLLVNAAQAGSTAITIVGRLHPSGKSVVLSFSDNGSGMSAETQARIFEPFFSTKGVDNGGLGLSISKQILERHGAAITVESAVGRGTTFMVELRTSSFAEEGY